MVKEKELLGMLFRVADGHTADLRPGMVKNAEGKPILYIARRDQWNGLDNSLQIRAKEFLELLVASVDACEARINIELCSVICSPVREQAGPKMRPQGQPGVLVPLARCDEDLPVAIIAVALTTPTESGDCLADRVEKCVECKQYFIAKTRRPSRLCTNACKDEYRKGQARKKRSQVRK